MLMVVMGENVQRPDKSKRLSRFDKRSWYKNQQYSYYIRYILINIHGRSTTRNSLLYSGRAIC